MSTKMLLSAKLEQRLTMNQQLSQAITLLQYNSLDLKLLVQQYIQTNPLIEIEETADANTSHLDHEDSALSFKHLPARERSSYANDSSTLENYANPINLRQHLLDQTLLCQFDAHEQVIAEAIIDAIDDDGYLEIPLTAIQSILSGLGPPSIQTLEKILSVIHSFDPIGVGASNARECLLIQLHALTNQDAAWHLAKKILDSHFDSSSYNTTKLMRQLGINQQEFSAAIALIRTLDPKPGRKFTTDNNLLIEPELFVKKIKNEWRVFLTDSILTSIKINNHYQEIIKQNKKHASFEAMNKELQEAQWLLKGLKRRNETLLNVAKIIVKTQANFIEHGPAFMLPMNIIDVSQALELHESTVSRVTTGKYLATPRGVFELKFFFPSYVLTESGKTCSDTAVKELIKEIIIHETPKNIYSDNAITELLKQKGIHIARRTVTKYREALKILPSYQRAQSQSRES